MVSLAGVFQTGFPASKCTQQEQVNLVADYIQYITWQSSLHELAHYAMVLQSAGQVPHYPTPALPTAPCMKNQSRKLGKLHHASQEH